MEKQKKIRWRYKGANGTSGKVKGNKNEIERKFTLYQKRNYVVNWNHGCGSSYRLPLKTVENSD